MSNLLGKKFIILILSFFIIFIFGLVYAFSLRFSFKDSLLLKNASEKKENILFISIDNLKIERISCYGYSRDTSPNIDAISKLGVKFDQAYIDDQKLIQTIASLFTGKDLKKQSLVENNQQQFPGEYKTLAELLSEAGYYTAALIDSPQITKELNYDQGFKDFIVLFKKAGLKAYEIDESSYYFIIKEVRNQLNKEKPFFIYLHIAFPHEPYTPLTPYNSIFDSKNISKIDTDMYDGEVRYTDSFIGDVFKLLNRRGLLDSTYVVITSNHRDDASRVKDQPLKIPFIVYSPIHENIKNKEVDSKVDIYDIFAGILDMAKIGSLQKGSAKSFLEYF